MLERLRHLLRHLERAGWRDNRIGRAWTAPAPAPALATVVARNPRPVRRAARARVTYK